MPVCPRWRTARCDQLDDSIQVWRPVVESAWCELSSSPQEGWGLSLSAQALLLTWVSASLLVALSTWSSPTQAAISFTMAFFYYELANSHAHAHYRKVQGLLPVSAHGEFLSHRKKVVSCLVVRSQDFRDE